jgi:hypothetical protein
MRMCPFYQITWPATMLTGTLRVSEPGGMLAPGNMDTGTIQLTLRRLGAGGCATGVLQGITHRVDILATFEGRTIDVPAMARITSAAPEGPFTAMSATSRDPEARKCAAPVDPGTTAPLPFTWPDQTTTLNLLADGTGYAGVMTYDSCPDHPALLKQEHFTVRIP